METRPPFFRIDRKPHQSWINSNQTLAIWTGLPREEGTVAAKFYKLTRKLTQGTRSGNGKLGTALTPWLLCSKPSNRERKHERRKARLEPRQGAVYNSDAR